MKKNLTKMIMVFAILSVFNGYSQTFDLKPIYQVFTSSTCVACKPGNELLDGILDENLGMYSLIKYQVNWPSPGDPYYTAEAGVRVGYYNVTGVPSLFINTTQLNPNSMTQELFDENIGLMTSMNIMVNTAEVDEAGMLELELELEVDTDYESGLTLQTVIVERVTTGNVGNNNETEFHNVMLKMLPNAYGTTLGALSVNNNETFSFTYDMSQTFMEQASDLSLIVFVQDDSDQSIIQSNMIEVIPLFDTYEATFIVEDCAGNSVEGATVTLESIGALVTDENGELMYSGLTNGVFPYDVSSPGLYPTTGSIEINNASVTENVSMEIPSFLYYQDFMEGIPDNWTVYQESYDYLYWYDGEIIYFRQMSDQNLLMLVSESLDIADAEIISFEIGNGTGNTSPGCAFGYVTNPLDPETFTELVVIPLSGGMEVFEYELTDLSGEVYFAWKYMGMATMTSFILDNVVLEGNGMPDAPTNLNIELDDIYGVNLNWDDYGGCNKTITDFEGFNVYRSIDGAAYEIIASGLSDNTFADSDLEIALYEYYVTVVVDDMESEASNIVFMLITSMDKITSNTMQVYPNPVTQMINISSQKTINEIIVYNQLGQIVLLEKVNLNYYSHDISGWNSGIYFVQLKTGESIISKHIVKE